MKGQETAPINEHSLASLLGPLDIPYEIVIGKPANKDKLTKKAFTHRVRKKNK
ncbi:hypothetical protein [Stenotrophomonas phage BUCTxx99]|nr:hypothetical protein [Stenotrophomonas phage BUCTxx99]